MPGSLARRIAQAMVDRVAEEHLRLPYEATADLAAMVQRILNTAAADMKRRVGEALDRATQDEDPP